MCAGGCVWLPPALFPHTPTILPLNHTDDSGGNTLHQGGDPIPPTDRGHHGATTSPSRILFLHSLHSSQEGWRSAAHNKPKGAEQVRPPPSLQNGGNPDSERHQLRGGLHVQIGCEGCLLYDPNCFSPPEVSLFSMGEESFPLHLPPIRSVQRSSHIHEGNKTSGLLPQRQRSEDGNLDMLCLHQENERLVGIRNMVVDLLENLGFLVNYRKSELHPVQYMQFLGFKIDSLSMEISVPREKVLSTVREAQNFLQKNQVSARQLAHMIGIFSSTIPAVLPAPLHYRGLKSLKHQALRAGNYNLIVPMSREARDDLDWWIIDLQRMNGQPQASPLWLSKQMHPSRVGEHTVKMAT